MPQWPAVGLGREGPRSEQALEVTQYSRHRGACGIFLLMVVCVRVRGSAVCNMRRGGVGAERGRQSSQSMPKPSQPSLMASCSILCTSSYESYVGRHSWLKHVCAVGSVLWVGAAMI